MKRSLFYSLSLLFAFHTSNAQQEQHQVVERSNIERIINGLASDDMRGRHALTPDIAKAADFIANEFSTIGLRPYDEPNYRQTFTMAQVSRVNSSITWNNKAIAKNEYLIIGNNTKFSWNDNPEVPIERISKDDDFSAKFRQYAQSKDDVIVLVDPAFQQYITRFNKIYGRDNMISVSKDKNPSKVFIVTKDEPKSYRIDCENAVKPIDLFNVAAVIPGKSKPNEYVVFAGHYDHIGIINGDSQDSIANGADDDASGVTALISLAKYYKQQDINERTLIFVAFTAEEIGMYGSKYFSSNINADSVVAMINIEMIGKESKFGKNSLFITGYDRSNLGELMQQNLKGTDFTFHPDPYPAQNLFYRSDNAVLAALGVPAHTFSTSQIDNDKLYHSVKDEVNSLDIDNIKASIEAIAAGVKGIVEGKQTPTRVEKLKD